MDAPEKDLESARAELLEVAALWRSAKDALSDDIVGRLGGTVAEGLDLVDRATRADLGRAIAPLAQLLEHGDLERLIGWARVLGAMQDALSDDIVTRLGSLAGDGMVLLEDMLRAGVPEAVLGAIASARQQAAGQEPSRGGVSGLWEILKDPEVQDTLRFFLLVGRELRKRLQA